MSQAAGGYPPQGYWGGAFTFASGPAFPPAPNQGDVFYRTDLNELFIYNGTNWVSWDVTQPTYIIYTSAGVTWAKSGTTGNIDFSGTDAAAVIQAAVNAIGANGGKIFIKAGDYNLTSKVVITNGGITIEGEQQAKTIFNLNTNGMTGFSIEPAADVKQIFFRNIRFQDNAGGTTTAIDFAGTAADKEVWQFHVTECEFRDVAIGIKGDWIINAWITRNWFYNTQTAAVDIAKGTDVRLIANHIHTAAGKGFYFHGDLAVLGSGMLSHQNGFFDVDGRAIDVLEWNNVIITDSFTDWSGGIRVAGCTTFNISGNFFGSSSEDAIYLEAVKNGFVIGNCILNLVEVGSGIHIKSTVAVRVEKVVVAQNVIYNSAYHGIWVENAFISEIVDNVITDMNKADPINTYSGIRTETFDEGSIAGNTFAGGGRTKYWIEHVSGNVCRFLHNHMYDSPISGRVFIEPTTWGHIVKNNVGYVTENSGTATIANGTNSVTVAHGLAGTPTSIVVTGQHEETRDLIVTTVGAANFDIETGDGANVTGNRAVYWKAQYVP